MRGFQTRRSRTEPAFHVGILLLDDFTLLSFAAFTDTLRLAADEGDRSRQVNCRWTVLGTSLRPVISSCGASVAPWETLGDPSRFDYIAVIGGPIGEAAKSDPAVIAWVRQAALVRTNLIGICTGTFTLFRAGVMEGRQCCINAGAARDFAAEFPSATPKTDSWFTVDGSRITSPGGIAAADVAAFLVKRHCGEGWALKAMQLSLLPGPKSPTHPQPLVTSGVKVEHSRLGRAVALIEQRLWEPMTVSELSRHVGLSERQLQRLFRRHFGCSPLEFSRNLRLRYGRSLLKGTDRTVRDIANSCGFRAAAHFCREFKALFKMSPSEARALDRRSTTESTEDSGHAIRSSSTRTKSGSVASKLQAGVLARAS
jgi:transcriptional regulator GlxA family with amidase domain